MKTDLFLRIRGIFFLMALLFLCGFSNVKLTDIELALIEKDYEKAGSLAQEMIARNSSSVNQKDQALYYLGLSQLGLERYEEARDSFRHLLRYPIERKMADQAGLGVIDSYLLEENYSQALSETEKLLKESPRSEYLSLIYLKLARANLKLSQWAQAQDYLKKIIKQFPGSPEAHAAQQLLEEKQYFAVQLGAFLDRNLAEKLAAELMDQDEYAYIVETTDKTGKKFYRVRVGQLATLSEAQGLKSEMSQQGYPTQIYP